MTAVVNRLSDIKPYLVPLTLLTFSSLTPQGLGENVVLLHIQVGCWYVTHENVSLQFHDHRRYWPTTPIWMNKCTSRKARALLCSWIVKLMATRNQGQWTKHWVSMSYIYLLASEAVYLKKGMSSLYTGCIRTEVSRNSTIASRKIHRDLLGALYELPDSVSSYLDATCLWLKTTYDALSGPGPNITHWLSQPI